MFSGNILVIVQRSNGDVFLSTSLINQLKENLRPNAIDLLVNDDTIAIAKALPGIRHIYTFSYQRKKEHRWQQEKNIIKKIYRKYDLSINLTASDRSVLYAIFASKFSISAIEKNLTKSWWKKIFLTYYYFFDNEQHILINNLKPIEYFDIKKDNTQQAPKPSNLIMTSIKSKLRELNINKFIIFHPSAQYNYKIYPQTLRNDLLVMLNDLNIPIIITGGNNTIDLAIEKTIPRLENIVNWIGKTSIEEYIALSQLSEAYIGMDTLNMHIAAAQNKRIFAIFGPTKVSMWSPWSNISKVAATRNIPVQTYENITIFQADMKCVACGLEGCNNSGKSNCLDNIEPSIVFNQIKYWLFND